MAPDGTPAHAGSVTALDWSSDGALLRSGCSAGTLCHWDAGGRSLLPPDVAAAVAWCSSSVTCAWGATGLWPPPSDTHRGGVVAVERSPEGDASVSGDTRGAVCVFRWPATEVGAGHRRYRGHASRVSAVSFSWDDRFVASVGADGTMIVWRHWNEWAHTVTHRYIPLHTVWRHWNEWAPPP